MDLWLLKVLNLHSSDYHFTGQAQTRYLLAFDQVQQGPVLREGGGTHRSTLKLPRPFPRTREWEGRQMKWYRAFVVWFISTVLEQLYSSPCRALHRSTGKKTKNHPERKENNQTPELM